MIYRENPKNGEKLSQLGLGCMRFPRRGIQIRQAKADEIVANAIDLGVNYYDTAYVYSGSEEALGSALKTLGRRRDVNIATKLPPFMCKSREDFNRIWSQQLERLKTDYVDYYLLHMLGNLADWERLRGFGAEEWIAEKMRSGQIRNIGFSFHGKHTEFTRLIDAFDWGFCMLQYNYYDEKNQAGKEGVQYASRKGLPVFIMEPLRGGMLANELPKASVRAFMNADKERTPAEWGFAWLLDQPEPTMILSGMSNLRMLKENAAVSSLLGPGCLSETDRDVYTEVIAAINTSMRVPCTGCNYCMPCSYGVDIPACFKAYNASYIQGFFTGIYTYSLNVGAIQRKQSYASQCRRCMKCEIKCPQEIKIADRLNDVSRRLESFWFRPTSALARRIMLGKK